MSWWHELPTRPEWILVITLAVVRSALAQATPVDSVIGAASTDHMWFALPAQSKTWQLSHHPRSGTPWHFRDQHALAQAPVAMAAWGDRVWIMNPSRAAGDRWNREVYCTRIVRNVATNLYFTSPPGRLEMLPALDGLGRVGGMVAGSDGPVILLLPVQHAAVEVVVEGRGANSIGLAEPRLLRLAAGGSKWEDVRLPHGFTGQRQTLLAAIGRHGRDLVLLEVAADHPSRCMAYFRQPDGVWVGASLALDLRNVRTLLNVAGQALAVVDDIKMGEVNLCFLRLAGTFPLTRVSRPTTAWSTWVFDGRICIVSMEQGSEPTLNVLGIDPLTGVTLAQRITRQPASGRLWQGLLAVGLSFSVVLALVMFWNRSRPSIAIGVERILPLGPRMAAGLLDFALGAGLAMWLLECSWRDLLAMPLVAFDPARCGPYALSALIGAAISTTLELTRGRSVGKMLFGGRVVTLGGSRSSAGALLSRGLIRLTVVLIPPLAFVILTNPHMQGLHDVVSRTLVVKDEVDPAQGDPDAPS